MPKSTSSKSNLAKGDDSVRTDWHSIYVASVLSFVGTVQFSLFFSSMWPYVQIIDRSINETMFGWVIAVYSFGQIISSPLFGFWSNRIKQIRLPLHFGLILMFLGNLCYLSLGLVPKRLIYVLLLFGRFVTGMGSGNVCLLRTYASTASTSKDRFRAIAFVTCGQALGNTGGPALQLLFTSLSYPGPSLVANLRLNLYTAPALLACLMNFVGMLTLWLLFKEQYAGLIEREKAVESVAGTDVEGEGKSAKLPPYDLLACFICYMSRFTQMFVNTNLETIGSPFSMMMFGWAEEKSVTATSVAQGLIGGITFAVYILYIGMKSNKDDLNFRLSCMLSLLGLAAFHLFTFSWPFLPGSVPMYTESQRLAFEYSASEPPPVGCNTDKFSWCQSLSPVNVWLYYVSYVLCIGLSFPVLNIAMNTLFSHILGPRRQGTQQGFFQMSGSVARMLGPVMISAFYTLYGPRLAWLMELAVIGLTLLMWLLFYQRMVPLLSRLPAKSGHSSATGSTNTLNVTEKRHDGGENGQMQLSPPVDDRRGKLSVAH